MATLNDCLSASDLKGVPPELDFADLAEFRVVMRPFPRDRAERECYRHLLERMRASPDRPPGSKPSFEKYCRARFRNTKDSFEYCWREAIKVSGASWALPGRPPRR
jgi:hypothetical protein